MIIAFSSTGLHFSPPSISFRACAFGALTGFRIASLATPTLSRAFAPTQNASPGPCLHSTEESQGGRRAACHVSPMRLGPGFSGMINHIHVLTRIGAPATSRPSRDSQCENGVCACTFSTRMGRNDRQMSSLKLSITCTLPLRTQYRVGLSPCSLLIAHPRTRQRAHVRMIADLSA